MRSRIAKRLALRGQTCRPPITTTEKVRILRLYYTRCTKPALEAAAAEVEAYGFWGTDDTAPLALGAKALRLRLKLGVHSAEVLQHVSNGVRKWAEKRRCPRWAADDEVRFQYGNLIGEEIDY